MDALEISPTTCPNVSSPTTDVTWLLHRSAQLMRLELDAMAQEYGLSGQRDWIVLALLRDGKRRTQLEIGAELGLDKTTLTAVIDRLERAKHVVRTIDPSDRRARVPELTASGRELVDRIASVQQAIESCKLSQFTDDERAVFLSVLNHLAGLGDDSAANGSCM